MEKNSSAALQCQARQAFGDGGRNRSQPPHSPADGEHVVRAGGDDDQLDGGEVVEEDLGGGHGGLSKLNRSIKRLQVPFLLLQPVPSKT